MNDDIFWDIRIIFLIFFRKFLALGNQYEYVVMYVRVPVLVEQLSTNVWRRGPILFVIFWSFWPLCVLISSSDNTINYEEKNCISYSHRLCSLAQAPVLEYTDNQIDNQFSTSRGYP